MLITTDSLYLYDLDMIPVGYWHIIWISCRSKHALTSNLLSSFEYSGVCKRPLSNWRIPVVKLYPRNYVQLFVYLKLSTSHLRLMFCTTFLFIEWCIGQTGALTQKSKRLKWQAENVSLSLAQDCIGQTVSHLTEREIACIGSMPGTEK